MAAHFCVGTALEFAIILSLSFMKGCFCLRFAPTPSDRVPSSDGYGGSYDGHAPAANNVFDVTSFGAKGSAQIDDTKAFQAAWQAACGNRGSAETILNVPAGWTFWVGPITFSGPCYSAIRIQIQGTIASAVHPAKWLPLKLLQWINIINVKDLTITGSGVIDGQGHSWWNYGTATNDYQESLFSAVKPTAVRFYGGINVTVEGIQIINSANCHLKFDNSMDVHVTGITVLSPANSPNTDGIHLQNSQNVEIQHSNLACGDDCVSIQTGCSDIRIHHLTCGPSHGISIGSLGQGGVTACVSNVSVHDCIIRDSLNGARIKTWQGGQGIVTDVSFESMQLDNVWMGITIDQFYCGGGGGCRNASSGVDISRVTFQKFRGSFIHKALSLACSDVAPCTGLTLADIQLQPHPQQLKQQQKEEEEEDVAEGYCSCWNSYGVYEQPLEPADAVECLHSGVPQGFHGLGRSPLSHSHDDFHC